MTGSSQDIWTQWLLDRRFGGDQQRMQEALTQYLYPVRDKVLSSARLGEGEVLLDVGCGDGLIAFGALEQVETSTIILSDISQDLLDHTRRIAQEMNVLDRCQFFRAPADDLSAIDDASIDVVTTRAVLIFVSAKQKAFNEFYRVLKPGGRLSIYEPINRFGYPPTAHTFGGYDVTPIQEIAQKVWAIYRQIQPATDPMLDFDERDLIVFAEKAGFKEIHLELRADIQPRSGRSGSWEIFLRTAGNPKIPTVEEAVQQTLTADETEKFLAYLQPLVETGQGTTREAEAHLWAVKH